MAPPYGPHRPDHEVLRDQVRARIASGALPQVAPARLLAGYGENQACDVCGQSVSRAQMLYEVELRNPTERKTLYFHLACHAAWQLEVSDTRDA